MPRYGMKSGGEATYRYELLTSVNAPAFDAFHEIYVEAIPPSERKGRAQLGEMVSRDDYRCLLLELDGAVLGFCIAFVDPGEGLWLLEYMAIADGWRGNGLGSALFTHAREDIVQHYGLLTGLLEVDSVHEPAADLDIRLRRQRFYRRQGCRRIEGLTYTLPLDGEESPPQMELMVCSADGARRLGRGRLEQWLRVLYTKVYDCAADDPRIAAMLQPLGEQIELN